MMTFPKHLALCAFLAAPAFACANDKPAQGPDEQKGPAEKAGETVDETAEDVKEGAVKGAEKVEQAGEGVVEAVKDAG